VYRSTEATLKKRTTTTTTTRTDIREALAKAQEGADGKTGQLLRLRPRAKKTNELELRGQEFEHTRALLAMIEQEAIEALRDTRPARKQSAGEAEAKAEIIALLRDDS